MLKKLKLGQKDIPIPVPVKNLSEAILWIESTLVPKGSIVTRIFLDGQDVLAIKYDKRLEFSLNQDSKLEVQIESPWELSLQTLDAARDLACELGKRLKSVAVECWQLNSDVHLNSVREIHNDLGLIDELVTHLNGILDFSQKQMAPINGLIRLINRPAKELKSNIRKCDWKTCSHLLLNRIEPLVKEFINECENLQIDMISNKSESSEPKSALK